MSAALQLLAQVPEGDVYINPVKLGATAFGFLLWILLAQWIDKDTLAVNTFRIVWNLVMLGAGILALLLVVLIPLFAVGLPLMLVTILAVTTAYVLHRNSLVKEEDTVLTLAHFRRLREEGLSGRKKKKEIKERVRLTGSDRKVVSIPDDEVEREQYRLTQDLMFNGLWRRATIVEVAPAGPQIARVTYHVDGVPYEGDNIERPDADALVQFVKRIAGLNLEERRKPQKGEIMAAIGDNKHKVLVRTDGSTAGEKLSIRIIYKETDFKVTDLGFTPKQLESAQLTKAESRGVIILSAPAGAGLTTSIYSFVRNHDRYLSNVQTIEYDKELDLDNVTQAVFNPQDGPSFADRLLKVVRADPDIIVLPEVREREVATIASKAAAEKQKVYIGMQAIDVIDALRKWIATVGDKALVAKSLAFIGNQRLIRKLCNDCRQAYKPDPQMMRKLNLPEDKVLYRPPEPQFDKRGNPILCISCQGTGYVGRTAVFDWLAVDDALREVIRRSTGMTEIQNYLAKKGGLGLQAHALHKVLEGITSIQEVARCVRADGTVAPVKAGAEPAKAAAGAKSTAAGAAAPRPRPKPRPRPGPGGSAGTAPEGR